jgi:hypothetical protein
MFVQCPVCGQTVTAIQGSYQRQNGNQLVLGSGEHMRLYINALLTYELLHKANTFGATVFFSILRDIVIAPCSRLKEAYITRK